MTKRLRRRYKLLKFYQEDLWGRLAIRKPFKKVKINRLFHEIFQEKNAFRNELQAERTRIREQLGVDVPGLSFKERKRRNLEFRRIFREFVKGLRHMHFRIPFNFRIDKGKPKRKVRRLTRFARRLKNRHKLRRFATQSMTVRQLRSYFRRARQKRSIFVQFFRLLETRADTLAFRLNFVENAGQARQLLNHKNFLINGKVVSFPTESIDIFDVFSVKDKQFFYNKALDLFSKKLLISSIPAYLEINFRIMSAVIYTWPLPSKVFYVRNLDSRLLVANGPRIRN
jgi:small subunit ribosomal protein S4